MAFLAAAYLAARWSWTSFFSAAVMPLEGGGGGFIRIHCTTITCMQIFISSRNATSLWLFWWLFWSPHFWHLQFSSLLLQVKAVYHQVQSHRLNMCHHVDRCKQNRNRNSNPVFFSSGLLSCCIEVTVFRGRQQMEIKGDRKTTVPKNIERYTRSRQERIWCTPGY